MGKVGETPTPENPIAKTSWTVSRVRQEMAIESPRVGYGK